MCLRYTLKNEAYRYCRGIDDRDVPAFTAEEKIELWRCRNDSAAVQLLLTNEEEMVVTVSDAPCFNKQGDIEIVRVAVDADGIDPDNFIVQLIGLVEDDDRLQKADILLDQKSQHISAKQIQTVWIEITLPEETSPGVYSPNIRLYTHRMFAAEKLVASLDFTVHVTDTVLPSPSQNRFFLDLWQHPANIARKYDVELWSDDHFTILANYCNALAALGQKSITIIASEIPWSGQYSAHVTDYCSDFFEFSMVGIQKRTDGSWEYDFSPMDRYIELCMRYYIDEEIEVFGLLNIWDDEQAGFGSPMNDLGDAVRLRYFDTDTGTYRFMKRAEDFYTYIKAMENHFIEKGWIEKVRIAADEPSDRTRFNRRVQAICKVVPRFLFKVAFFHPDFISPDTEQQDAIRALQAAAIQEGDAVSSPDANQSGAGHFIPYNNDQLRDYVPLLSTVTERPEILNNLRRLTNGRLLYYVCCNPEKPNSFIGSDPVEVRVLGWLVLLLGLDGFLRWSFTAWPGEPLKRVSYKYPKWRAGDTHLVYPGKNGKPLLSLRYKALQRGIRDYTLITSRGELSKDGVKLHELIHGVVAMNTEEQPALLTYSKDYFDYESIINKVV